MKNIIKLTGLISLVLFSILNSCRKDEVPTVTTSPVSNFTSFTSSRALCGGEIKDEGASTVIERGVCWSTSTNPTKSDNKTSDGAGAGSFTSTVIGLNQGTKYYIRAFATNSVGTGYGMVMSITTLTSNIPSNGLVAYFPFDGDADDKTLNANNGTVNGATLTNDRFSYAECAYYFDGVSNTITGNTNNWPLGNSSRTISIWVKLSTLPSNGENKLLLSYGPEIEHAINTLYFQYTQANEKRVFYGGFFDDIYSSFDYQIDTWYNVVGTFDGTYTKLYLNGELNGIKNSHSIL